MRPPSQAFQFQLIVATIAAASSTTKAGTTNLCHFGLGFGGSGTCSGSALLTGAGVLAVAIIATPSQKVLLRIPARSNVVGRWRDLWLRLSTSHLGCAME